VKREQKASPFPLSNARRQLSAWQPGPYSFWIEELIAHVCKVVVKDGTTVIDDLFDGEEPVLELFEKLLDGTLDGVELKYEID